jgi:uncharacterized protein (PEP-CTERM system associated)
MSSSTTDKKGRGLRAQLLATLGIFTFPLSCAAAEWIISPALALDHIYTDNVLLANEDQDPEKESITRLRPSISAYREGSRARLDFNYAPEFRYYWDDTRDNETAHYLRTNGNAELMQNHLFVDAWASMGKTRLSTSRSSSDGITGDTEHIDYYTLGVSPYYTTRFGNTSVLEARYSADKVDYDDDSSVDSTSQDFNLVLGSGTYTESHAWELSGTHIIEDFTGVPDDNTISKFSGEYIQKLTRQWAVAFGAGYEEFDLVLGEDEDGEIWSVGLIFTPGSHTRFSLAGGERAFGDNYTMDFTHRSGHMSWDMDFQRDYISARSETASETLFQRQDEFGEVVRDAVLDNPPPIILSGISTLSAEYYMRDLLRGTVTFRTTRTRLSLNSSLTKRDFSDNRPNTRDIQAGFSFSRVLSRRYTGITRAVWEDHEENLQDFDQWSFTLGLNYQLGQESLVSLQGTHVERESENELGTYDENRVRLGFQTRF